MEETTLQMAYYLAEGHTVSETAREFRSTPRKVRDRLEALKFRNSKLYEMALNKYSRAVRATLELKVPICKALKKFRISRENFNMYLEKELRPMNAQTYVVITYLLYCSKS